MNKHIQISHPCSEHPKINIRDLFATLERLTGLEISAYPAPGMGRDTVEMIRDLPAFYRRHVSDFCRAIKTNKTGVGCKGHDSFTTNRKAGSLKQVFVQVCHAGVAEAIVPVHAGHKHLATIFIGQVVTPQVAAGGVREILARTKKLGVDSAAVTKAFSALPRMSEQELEQIGLFLSAALHGLASQIGIEAFERQMMLHNYPQLDKAIQLLQDKRNWSYTEKEVAQHVYLDPAYFCRLFKKVMGRTFVDYITEKRIDYALRLLHQTNINVGEIASECGYARQSYFTRRFKEITGMTPSTYRRRGKAQG